MIFVIGLLIYIAVIVTSINNKLDGGDTGETSEWNKEVED